VNLRDLAGFEAGTEINPVVLTIVGLVNKRPQDPVVVLGDGDIKVALTVKAHRFSKSAQEKIEQAGGRSKSCRSSLNRNRFRSRLPLARESNRRFSCRGLLWLREHLTLLGEDLR
jgi:hypothetical protein